MTQIKNELLNLQITENEFLKSIIAQDDDCDYDESGYVVLHVGNMYYIAHYSHCSCYGTYDALCSSKSGTVNTMWVGDKESLLLMAKEIRDPSMPERAANEKDCDYDHLCKVYAHVCNVC